MKIAVFFPGIGYHCDKPLLYYARKLVQEYGYEKIVMQEYSYNGKNIRGDKKKMQEAFESLYAQAEKKLEEIAFDEYSEVLFISKSVIRFHRASCPIWKCCVSNMASFIHRTEYTGCKFRII